MRNPQLSTGARPLYPGSISRRAFLKAGMVLGASAVAPPVILRKPTGETAPPEWPTGVPLGRVTVTRTRRFARPNPDATPLDYLYFDAVVPVLRYVVGLGFYPHNHVWAETPDGFIYSSWLQPAVHQPNVVPASVTDAGMWTEVSLPFVDARLEPQPDATGTYRLYHSAVLRVKARVKDELGNAWVQIDDENGYRMFVPAEALRPIDADELQPIAPHVEEKLIRVDLHRQSLSAYEGSVEVFRCRVASGTSYFAADGSGQESRTALGSYPIWSKRISRHMEGGDAQNGYDLPGVGWVSYFAADGAAIHSTYWHNDFGAPKSHGCLNVRPADARWLFRWTAPQVDYNPGVITVEWPGGTRVVVEG